MSQTWTDIVERGRGTADFRLRIEGVQNEFCTVGMATGAGGGFIRYHGLEREGLGFSESCYLAGAEQSVQIQPVKINDGAGAQRGIATALFSRIARVLDQLQETVTAAGSPVYVRDSALCVEQYGYVGTETMFFDSALSGTELDTSRGQFGSTAQTHHVSLGGPRPSVSPIYDHPSGFTGRRVWLYAHGPGETGLGSSGTIVWRGFIGKEPSEADGVWTLQIESRLKALDGSLAAGFDALKIRGCYYPEQFPFYMSIAQRASADKSSAITSSIAVSVSGFFETRGEFLAALVAALTSAVTPSFLVTFDAREAPDGTWDLYMRTPAASPKWISVFGGSTVDGLFNDEFVTESSLSGAGGSSGSLAGFPAGVPFSAYISTIALGTTYRVERGFIEDDAEVTTGVTGADLRRVPCRNLGGVYEGAAGSTSPSDKLHLQSVAGITTDDLLILTPLGEDEGRQLRIYQVDASGYIRVTETLTGPIDVANVPPALAVGAAQPGLAGAALFGGGDADLDGFRADLIARAPDICNLGTGPWVTDDDLADWSAAVIEAAGGRAWALHRSFAFGSAQRTIEVLREEWKLLGLIPYLDADAKISIRPLTFETRAPDYEISAEHRIIDDGFGSTFGDDDGLVTTVHFSTGYDPIEDKHFGDQFIVSNQSAKARIHAERKLEVKPLSNAVGEEMGPDDAYSRGLTVTEIFGARRTQTVEFDVSLVMFPVLVGDAVLLTIPQLPGDGTRGIWTSGGGLTGRAGYVVSRSWDLSSGRGTLRVLLHELAIAGYTPSGKVASASGATTSWVLTLTAGHYSGTASDAQFFTVGDSIRLREWDSDSPTEREGVVSATNPGADTVSVTLASSWAGTGGSRYTLSWDTSSDADTQASQLEAVYIAGATGVVATASSTTPSKRFAP